MLNVGILGCGRIGQVHALSISRLAAVRVVAGADVVPEAAKALAASTGAQVMKPQALIDSPSVDSVTIATPTDSHYDQIHTAARAVKAIFCEKPVDLSADRIRDCIKVVDAAGVPFMTAFNRRFGPNFANLQVRLWAGEIGQVELVSTTSRDPAPPPVSYIERSGGIFRDMMIHDLDMARILLAEDPVQVFAVGSALIDPAIAAAGDVDTAAVTLTTASGAICE